MVFTTLEEGWAIMEAGLSKLKQIIEDEKPELHITVDEKVKIYTAIYDICSHQIVSGDVDMHQREMYKRYKSVMDDYVSSSALVALRRAHDGRFLLKQLQKRWETHKLMIRWMNHFFFYLDRTFIPHLLKCRNPSEAARVDFELVHLTPLAWRCFVKPVYDEMSRRFACAVIELIDGERRGKRIDRSLVKKTVDLFVEMGEATGHSDPMEYYVKGFEEAMLQDTAEYYSGEAARWLADCSLPDYMVKTEECMRKERERTAHYLHHTTEEKLIEVVKEKLLSDHENQLLHKDQSGCLELIKHGKVDDLTRMYHLFSKLKTEGLTIAVKIFKQCLADEGMALVKQTEEAIINHTTEADMHEKNFVWKVIEQHQKYMSYLSPDGCFNDDLLFHRALTASFEFFLGKRIAGSTTAELLAKFCDRILKKGGEEKLSEEAVEKALDSLVRVFAYIGDKDLFRAFHEKKLALRLLFETSAGNELEKGLISRLKQHCGSEFTSKMEGMLNDLTLTQEKQMEFAEYLKAFPQKKPKGIKLNVSVLNTEFWPSQKSDHLNLPDEMAKCIEVYNEFYQTTTVHRKLSWLYSFGTCNIVGHFKRRSIEMVVTTYQACVLMLFDSHYRLSFSEIVAKLNLPEEDVIKLLYSLSCDKYKILSKKPDTKNVSKTDVFEFNSKFTNKMRRIKIPLPRPEEEKKVIEDVDKDRRYVTDAAIVRIMKSRKVLSYQQLVAECIEQLSSLFKPNIKVIKRRIEDLIENDYLERDEEDPNTFKYVA